MWVVAVVILIVLEFVAFLVWLAHEPKHHHEEDE